MNLYTNIRICKVKPKFILLQRALVGRGDKGGTSAPGLCNKKIKGVTWPKINRPRPLSKKDFACVQIFDRLSVSPSHDKE